MNHRHHVLIAALLVAGASFVAGYGWGARGGESALPADGPEQTSAGPGAGAGGGRVLSALPVRGLRGRGSSGGALAGIARDGKLGMFVKLRAYLRLASSTPVDELGALLENVQREVPEELGGDALIGIIAKRWAKADPRGAFAALLAGEPRALQDAMGDVTEAFAAADPEAAWEMVLTVESPKRRAGLLGTLLGKLGDADIDAALARVAAMESPMLYRETLQGFLQTASHQHPGAVLGALDTLPPQLLGQAFYEEAFGSYASRDLDAALELFAALREPGVRSQALKGMVSGWAQRDLPAAMEWASALPTARERDIARSATLLHVQLRGDPAAAATAIADLRSPELRAGVAAQLAGNWYGKDEDAAMQWVDQTLEGSARIGALNNILAVHGDDMEFERLRELVEQIPGDGRARRDFAERWAETDPAAAARWVLGQEDGKGRLMREVYQQWVGSDLDAAAAFLGSVPEGQLLDVAAELVRRQKERAGDNEQDAGGDR